MVVKHQQKDTELIDVEIVNATPAEEKHLVVWTVSTSWEPFKCITTTPEAVAAEEARQAKLPQFYVHGLRVVNRDTGKYTQTFANPKDVADDLNDHPERMAKWCWFGSTQKSEVAQECSAQPEARELRTVWVNEYPGLASGTFFSKPFESIRSANIHACPERIRFVELREVLRDSEGNELPTPRETLFAKTIHERADKIIQYEARIAELEAEVTRLKDCWCWQGDGNDHLESMGNDMLVLISANQIRGLIAGLEAKNERISRDRETFLNAACYWWMTYHDAMGIVRPNAMSEGIREAVAKLDSERQRLKELEAENERLKFYCEDELYHSDFQQAKHMRAALEAERRSRRGDKAELNVVRDFVMAISQNKIGYWDLEHGSPHHGSWTYSESAQLAVELARQAREKAEAE